VKNQPSIVVFGEIDGAAASQVLEFHFEIPPRKVRNGDPPREKNSAALKLAAADAEEPVAAFLRVGALASGGRRTESNAPASKARLRLT